MKYIGLISSDARGKNGGNVASRNRFGTYLRRHVSPVQPRTTSQQANRNAFGAISSAWRGLTAAQIQGWNTLASTITLKDSLGQAYNPTGAQLFMLCSRYLIIAGGTSNASAPAGIPSIPALLTLTPTITVTEDAISAISLAYEPDTIPSGNKAFVYASKVVSAGVTFIGKSEYRFLTVLDADASSPASLLTEYENVFGTPATAGQIGFRMLLIDSTTGYPGPYIQAIATI